ncbi:hydroxyacylglutathione hydrolase [Loktanella sp. S4079]|uniref:hydroxyacylglutathione hydrolase n=1 Tax=Loktanella sp. S4079 TaxID=579483 RepID=UPI0005FA7D05|nr:hydroxyacylglutathione hydrolase [Loktanella sp. S4079]KJZ21173.1 hydroxyacylglutathione hydrolase [Loktanella sp. S4079]
MENTSSTLELVTVPCLSDNYAFLVHNPETKETALIDAPESAPIQAALDARGWVLTDILLTHHHPDHVDGVDALRGNARVIGAKADAHRLPALDVEVSEGAMLTVCGARTDVFDVSGHTMGHIAFYMAQPGYVFTADSLMAMGCGRLFEGTPAQMWDSLQKLRALPDETVVCSGHEYTESNMRFALTLDPNNSALISRKEAISAARANQQPTVPSTLGEEKRTNPFLRADDPAFKAVLGMETASDVDVFAEVRLRKDKF